ncbi:MAG: MBL fold metallo-hydrolase [Candidatus Binatia bacterium]
MVSLKRVVLVLAYVAWLTAPPSLSHADTEKPTSVFLTWVSVTNWLFEVGDTRIMTDGYITRIPEKAFSGLGFATATPARPDVAAIERVIAGLGNSGKIDFILTGHSHFDHSFDTATWAKLTGAKIIGSRSTCLQAEAQGIPASQCTAVEGGETMALGEHVAVRVVRWNHSGDVTTPFGKVLYTPLELAKVPNVASASAGLRPGTLQDFPNGGGARAYLFTAVTKDGPVSWFYSNTGNADTFVKPAPVDEDFFETQGLSLENLVAVPHERPPQDNLRAALRAAGIDRVGLWIGYSDRRLAEAVCSVLRPRTHIPHHWDGLFSPFFDGLPFAYTTVAGTDTVASFLKSQDVGLLPPQQYMDKFALTTKGVTLVANDDIKAALGLTMPSPTASGTGQQKRVVHNH